MTMTGERELQHWQVTPIGDGVIRLVLDSRGDGPNLIAVAVLDELSSILDDLDRRPPRGLIIASGKPGGFAAGADIAEFAAVTTSAQALQMVRRGQQVFDKLERLRCPSVAVIRGYCLGGGCELALACRYRVAADEPTTRLGLPEVKLGIHPGYGGTARLVATVGALAAMPLLLAGKTVDARRAAEIGLADHAVPARHVEAAALRLLRDQPPRRRPGLVAGLAVQPPLRNLFCRYLEKQTRRRVSPHHYPAPFAIIDLLRESGGDRQRMLDGEAASCARLAVTDTARNLVRVFSLQERLKGLARKDDADVRRVHVVGAGVMGGDIAAWCAWQGMTVTLADREPKYIAPALRRAHQLIERRSREPRLRQAALDRLCPDHRGLGVGAADVVIEAIVENADAKRALYATLEPRMKPGALLATNTSSIPLDDLTPALRSPERFVGLHFFNPVARMPLVEVVSAAATSSAACARALAFTRAIDRLPLPVKSAPGFLVNRVLTPYLLEAVFLLTEGLAPEVIDAAAEGFGMPMGPIELADTVGLDVCLAVGENLARHFAVAVPDLLRGKVAAHALGRKSGRGFYLYRNDKPVRATAPTDSVTLEAAAARLVMRLLNECRAVLREGVVSDGDALDAGMIFGAGFAPFRGGPLNYAGALGVEKVRQQLQDLASRHGPRFSPDPGWSNDG